MPDDLRRPASGGVRKITIGPQPGPQQAFLSTTADIAILGGAAGGGKSWSLLMEPLRHMKVKGFDAVIFRRTLVDVKKPGGLWDTSMGLYGPIGGAAKVGVLSWDIGEASVAFSHLDGDHATLPWMGSQVCLLCFDELTHFSRYSFFYMLSRNRSSCGVRPYVRATCNPDADSWVKELVDWWIDPESGYPIQERSGVVRWFVKLGDSLVWGDSRQEIIDKFPDIPAEDLQPKSFTFIPARLEDNKILTAIDPGYRANLLALDTVERERLLRGNWRIRPRAGLYFQRSWCQLAEAIPAQVRRVRYWDLASTEKTAQNDPDWTVGVRMAIDAAGIIYVEDVQRFRGSPHTVQQSIVNVAAQDGYQVGIGIPQDPGAGGKSWAYHLVTALHGYTISVDREVGKKHERFGPFSSQAQAGNVKIARAAFKEEFLASLEGFPDMAHDDDVDACSGAYRLLIQRQSPVAVTGTFRTAR
jgi:predicted phage terminase large subunit-like protein